MFRTSFESYVEKIDAFLECLSWDEGTMGQSMRYSLVGGGKRIRPVLALAAAEAVGGQADSILPSACALELIHTYSLIHDDLPAMDNDDYRRGRLANHKVFGEGKAILAGDGLLTYAFELIARPLPVNAERQLRVIQEVAQAAGPEGMVLGQVLDLEAEGKTLTLGEIEQIHQHKTGAMLVVSARMGGILGGGTEAQIQALTRYAQALGLAFQIKDDILDLEGDSATLGKPAQSDLEQEKSTYPSLLGLAGAKEELAVKIKEAHEALSVFTQSVDFLHSLADYIADRMH
ncbi:polyprenyl synthetase family protein [Desulfitobacterium metallireducens]|uniref:Farnesyl diphosphate synthase n=1 Tax=Desulfitobacterium metallireducens DSM 15288 TaxID=871968 RepID=W0EE78_9FIRM|nr:farnesyl diphosphate synthase [Desulfitobacterium metallireducens]AHF07376.1 farnesyl-diphosphate synthase [Desulfitobacterium metallireducens DSM 15288]